MLPFGEDYFGSVICTNSFHHYINPVKVLGEIRRVLKCGGRIYILDPTTDLFIGKQLDRRMRLKEPEHVKFYSTSEFRTLFEKAGLTPLKGKVIIPVMKVHIAEKQCEATRGES